MRKGTILRKIAIVLSLVMLITSTVNTTYCYITTSTDSIVRIFVPEDRKGKEFLLHKRVEHPLGEGYKIPDTISFDFKIELGSFYAGAKLSTTIGELTADESGALTVSVKPGVTFGIEGLQEGTIVKVTEQVTSLNGFSPQGEVTKEVTVSSDGAMVVDFVNVYTPDAVKPEKVNVSGVKVLEGRDWQEGDNFTFLLEQKNGEDWTEIDRKTVTYRADDPQFNVFDFCEAFSALTLDAVGTYTFRMREEIGDRENIDYDKTVNHFTVLVTDVDMDGKLEINTVTGTENTQVTRTGEQLAVTVTFNNTFVPPAADPDPIDVSIHIDKVLHNREEATQGLSGFEFVLEKLTTSEKWAVLSDTDGKASFTLRFTKEDAGKTFTYKLYETDQGVYGMTYDKSVYEIVVSVSLNEDNELIASLVHNGKTVDTLSVTFENTYETEPTLPPPTSDRFDTVFWLLMMIVSGATLVSLLIYDKRFAKG